VKECNRMSVSYDNVKLQLKEEENGGIGTGSSSDK